MRLDRRWVHHRGYHDRRQWHLDKTGSRRPQRQPRVYHSQRPPRLDQPGATCRSPRVWLTPRLGLVTPFNWPLVFGEQARSEAEAVSLGAGDRRPQSKARRKTQLTPGPPGRGCQQRRMRFRLSLAWPHAHRAVAGAPCRVAMARWPTEAATSENPAAAWSILDVGPYPCRLICRGDVQ
jgi:hypothetical protein